MLFLFSAIIIIIPSLGHESWIMATISRNMAVIPSIWHDLEHISPWSWYDYHMEAMFFHPGQSVKLNRTKGAMKKTIFWVHYRFGKVFASSILNFKRGNPDQLLQIQKINIAKQVVVVMMSTDNFRVHQRYRGTFVLLSLLIQTRSSQLILGITKNNLKITDRQFFSHTIFPVWWDSSMTRKLKNTENTI